MTSSSAHPPGTVPRKSFNGTAGPNGPPSDAVSLNDLIADSGPLPADAALECVQRLAILLDALPDVSCESLGPHDILIDDDGEVWLTRLANGECTPGPDQNRVRLDRLGRLLAFLATGENGHLSSPFTLESTSSPSPIASAAASCFARNGIYYHSYAELARDAAGIKEAELVEELIPDGATRPANVVVESTSPPPEDAEPILLSLESALAPSSDIEPATRPDPVILEERSAEITAVESETTFAEQPPTAEPGAQEPSTVPSRVEEPVAVQNVADPSESLESEESFAVTPRETSSDGSWLGVGIAVAVAAGAAMAYVVWQFL